MDEHLTEKELSSSVRSYLTHLLHMPHPAQFVLFQSSKEAFAADIAQATLADWIGLSKAVNEHPDLIQLMPEGKAALHSMESIRSFIQDIAMTPFGGSRRGVLIRHIDRMLPSSSNALLKTLEEPPAHTLLIGTTEKAHLLLPTIRSRAQEVRLMPPNVTSDDETSALHDLLRTYTQASTFTHKAALAERLESMVQQEIDEKVDGIHKQEQERARLMFEKEIGVQYLQQMLVVFLRREFMTIDMHSTVLLRFQQAFASLDKHLPLKDVFLSAFC